MTLFCSQTTQENDVKVFQNTTITTRQKQGSSAVKLK